MVSAAAHVGAQTGTSFVRSAQQVCEPVHGTMGHVGAPASPGPPLLDPLLEPLLLPEPLPLLEPLPPPDPLPLELLPPEPLPDEAPSVLASPPAGAPGLLLLEQPAHHAAEAATAAAVRPRETRESMDACVPRPGHGNMHVTV
jgi:hypothetical protein